MNKEIYRNEGFSKRYVGRINANGEIKVPDGIIGEDVVGEVRDDGVYVSDGIFSKKQIIEKTASGDLYLTQDRGIFGHGTYIGRIDDDGDVYDADKNHVLTVEGYAKSSKDADSLFSAETEETFRNDGHGDPAPELNLFPLLLLSTPIILGGIWVLAMSLPGLFITDSVSTNGKIGLTVVAAVMCIAEILAALASAQGGLIATATACTAAGSAVGTIAFIIYTLITEASTFGAGEWLLLIFFTPVICFAWAVAGAVVLGLPIFIFLKLFKVF